MELEKEIKYFCNNSCTPEGCPGHIAKTKHDQRERIFEFKIGDIEFKLNPEQLTALRSLSENYDYLYQKWN